MEELRPQRAALERAYGKIADQLSSSSKRWGRVKGTIGAVIASLLDLDWIPLTPTHWVDSDGEEFDLMHCDKERLLSYALSGAINQKVWAAAGQWHLGRGAELGVDLTSVRRHLQRLRRRGDRGKATMLEMVCTRSPWSARRRFGGESGRTVDRVQGPEDGEERRRQEDHRKNSGVALSLPLAVSRARRRRRRSQ